MEAKIIKAADGRSLLGGRQNIKLTGADTNESLSFMFSEVPAGAGVPVHTHQNEDEFFQVTEGQLEITIGENVQSANKGDLVFLPRNISHGFKAITDTKMWVGFSPAGAEQMFVELAALPPGKPDPKEIAIICARYAISFAQ